MIKVVKPHLYRILHGLFPYDKELLGRLQKCKKNMEDYRSCVYYATRIETQLLNFVNYEQNSADLKESFWDGCIRRTISGIGSNAIPWQEHYIR